MNEEGIAHDWAASKGGGGAIVAIAVTAVKLPQLIQQ
jgi:hypothetical protein